MIERASHIALYVEDVRAARAFYVDVLGFTPVVDKDLGSWRWVTVAAPAQPELQFVLLEIDQHLDAQARAHIRALQRSRSMPAVTLRTSDCQSAYDTLRARGVEFASAPVEQFFGVETTFYDVDGNTFSLVGARQ